MNHSFFSSWYSHSISRHFLILLHFLFLSATASIDRLTINVQYSTHQFICPKSNVPSNIKNLNHCLLKQIWAELWTDDIRFIKLSFIRSFHRRTEVPQELSLQIQHSLILPLSRSETANLFAPLRRNRQVTLVRTNSFCNDKGTTCLALSAK